jgi:hypothetical protein
MCQTEQGISSIASTLKRRILYDLSLKVLYGFHSMPQLISGTAFCVSVCKGTDNVTPTIRVLHVSESLIDALGMRAASPESLAIFS